MPATSSAPSSTAKSPKSLDVLASPDCPDFRWFCATGGIRSCQCVQSRWQFMRNGVPLGIEETYPKTQYWSSLEPPTGVEPVTPALQVPCWRFYGFVTAGGNMGQGLSLNSFTAALVRVGGWDSRCNSGAAVAKTRVQGGFCRRASTCGPGRRGFESRRSPQYSCALWRFLVFAISRCLEK